MSTVERVAALATSVTGAQAQAVRSLPGGVSNRTYLVRLAPARGLPAAVVVRIVADRDRAAHEAAALQLLSETEVPAPRMLARRRFTDGGWALVCSRVPGRPSAHPSSPGWLDGLAATLSQIHRVTGSSTSLPTDPGADRPWLDDPAPRELGPVAARIWPAIAGRRHELGRGDHVLVHGDYHAGNVHWRRARVMGVIDWELARWGPAAADVAYCYLDLVLAAGVAAARSFFRLYVSRSGTPPGFDAWLLMAATRPLPDPAAWLPSYELAGYRTLTAALLRRRLARLVRAIA